MVRAWDKCPKQLADIRKRIVREFVEGNITKKELDDAEAHLNGLEKLIEKIKPKEKK